ncbi:MAG: hypothetical protein NEA02_01490 [Thermoanaerobaculia bacterium]|nr:hypothetical protein [Thermoanaerobaculia bacterium]
MVKTVACPLTPEQVVGTLGESLDQAVTLNRNAVLQVGQLVGRPVHDTAKGTITVTFRQDLEPPRGKVLKAVHRIRDDGSIEIHGFTFESPG